MYKELKKKYFESNEIEILLQNTNISVLDNFLENEENIKLFNKTFYRNNYPKTVLCGINPGKNGAGKTGVPFIDFISLSKMLKDVNRKDTERSAQFFYEIVEEIGIERFYNSFYVTNISWVGYVKENKNLNYYDLPINVKAFIYDTFKYEMKIVSPTTIISLSGKVKETISKLFDNSNIDVTQQLAHPNYCAFPKNYDKYKSEYMDLLSRYLVK